MSKLIPLSNGQNVIVDDEDFEALSAHHWVAQRASSKGHGSASVYAVRCEKQGDGAWRSVWMHRVIMAAPPGISVDHIDRDPLNNRRANLRLATHQQNCCNRTFNAGRPKVKGVEKHKDRWRARIVANGIRYALGHHATAEDAARAYDIAATALHGPFAALNYPDNATHDAALVAGVRDRLARGGRPRSG